MSGEAEKFGERRRWGRFLGYGTVGLSALVAVLTMLAPSAGAAAVQPQVVLAPPYVGSSSAGSFSESVYSCASAHAAGLAWNATTGTLTGKNSASAKTCSTASGPSGGSTSFSSSGATVAVPFKVAVGGSRSITTSLKVSLTTHGHASSGGCPKSLVKYPPPASTYEYSSCYTIYEKSFSFYANVIDLNNQSWFANYAFGYNDTYSTWSNSTSCSNFGSISCSNFTGWSNTSYVFGVNEQGSIGPTGSGSFTFWTNGTNILHGHHYVLQITVSLTDTSYVSWYNVAHKWVASANASITMSGTGNGATISSIAIA